MDRRLPSLVLLAALACQAPEPRADAGRTAGMLAPAGPIRFVLPPETAAWLPSLQADARALDALLDQVLARWPRRAPRAPLALHVLRSPEAAAAWALELEVPGDPRTPRTHPEQRLAIVPMARVDRLLTEHDSPPRSLRETLRHEMAHLLMLDRPGLAAAPDWFLEGLAEAWVSLRALDHVDADSHLLGAGWRHALAAFPRLEDAPAEIRYTAWAELALQVLAADPGPRPWEHRLARNPRARLLEGFRREPESATPLPLPRGRDLDFIPGGSRILLAAADGETVALDARHWHGFDTLRLRVRVGQTGEPLAEILLGPPAGEELARVRLQGNGGIVAAWESALEPPTRAFRDRLPQGAQNRWRELELRLLRRNELSGASSSLAYALLVRSGEYNALLELPPQLEPHPGAPWLLRVQVSSGAFEVLGDTPLVAALR